MAKALALAAAARVGFRRFLSISAFTPPPPATVPPPAEPSPNLFISGLSKRTTSEGLREAFSKFGNLVHARVVTDRVSGYSKGFGFVKYATVEEASEGITGMDGKFLDGWVIFAEYAKPRPPPPSQDQSSQPPLNTSSAPSSKYTSQTSQSWSSYHASQASEPLSSHYSYTPQETLTPSNYSYRSAQTLQTPPSHNSVPPSNYSSEMSPPPSGFAPVRTSNYSQASESQLGYASGLPSGYTPQASQPPNYPPSTLTSAPTFNFPSQASHLGNSSMKPSSYLHQQSEFASSYASAPPNNFTQTSEIPSDNTEPTKYQTSKPPSDFESGLAADY